MSERWEPETIPIRENVVEIRDESGRRVCAVPADYPLSSHSWNRRIALIAAAPKMFELLSDVRRYVADANLRGDGYAEIDLKAIDALLAKIEGGTK